jgi:hypothetical protein
VEIIWRGYGYGIFVWKWVMVINGEETSGVRVMMTRVFGGFDGVG